MPRRVEDIIPGNRRSIRDVPVPRTKARESRSSVDEEVVKIHREHVPQVVEHVREEVESEIKPEHKVEHKAVKEKTKKKRKSHAPIIISSLGVIVLLAGLAFVFSGHFAKATFTLVAKNIPVHISGTYIIPSANATSTIASTVSAFGYETVTLSDVSSTTVPATQGTYTETKSQGPIIVYNSYSSQSQRLAAGSRLSGVSGLVYRLNSSIVVPGYKTSGKIIIPGSIATTMTAEKAGDTYNISTSDTISDLKFVTYKGTAKYSALYARLTGAVSGGFVGTKTIIAPTLLASTTATAQASLIQVLQSRMLSTIAPGYVMYPSVLATTFAKPTVVPIDSKNANLTVGVTVYGVIFKKTDFAKFLAGASSTSPFSSAGFDPKDIDTLSVIMSNTKDFSPLKKTNLVARINGSFSLIGSIPVDSLKKAFAGITLSKTADIIKKYSGVIDVVHSSAEMVPPWVTVVPKDQSRISIVVK